MLGRFRFRPNHATVVAYLALFVALGGGAYAAISLPKNSVGTKQLKDGAVATSKLARGAVTGSRVKPGSLTGTQIDASTLGTVRNASKLGGLGSSAYQSRVAGACGAATAIAQVNADGTVVCQAFPAPTAASSFARLRGIKIGGTSYGPVAGNDNALPNGPGAVEQLSPARAITGSDLTAGLPATATAGASIVISLGVNGSPTALSCTIAASQNSCADTTHSVTIPAGAHVYFQVDNSDSASWDVLVGWHATG